MERRGAHGSRRRPTSPAAAGTRWRALGPDVAAVLRPTVETLVDEVHAAVVVTDPPREWVDGVPNARHGVERGLRGLLELIAHGPHAPAPARSLYFGFGRGQQRAGRPLSTLLAAYHDAARTTWSALLGRGVARALAQETVAALADAIFAYLGELSAASADGFAFEQAARDGDGRRRRRRLLATLLDERGASRAELRAVAGEAGWRTTPPPTVAVVAFAGERTAQVAGRLGTEALVADLDGVGYAVLPDPGRPALHARRLAHVPAGLGPTVPLALTAESARWARLALALAERRTRSAAPGSRLVVADEHRVELLLLRAPTLADRLATELLAPLDRAPDPLRTRLLETLDAWLRHQGQAAAVARELHVHQQTVRYRVGQLRELLGPRLDEAEGRLELELALRARRLRPPAGG